jgi:hypothetical protein
MPRFVTAKVQELLPVVQDWHQRALPTIRTKDFADSWKKFTDAWQRVRSPGDGEVLVGVREWVQSQTDDPLMRLELAAEAIQARQGDEPFFLACRTAGELIGTSKTYAAELLAQLVDSGVLHVIKPSNKPQRRAVYYRLGIPSVFDIGGSEVGNAGVCMSNAFRKAQGEANRRCTPRLPFGVTWLRSHAEPPGKRVLGDGPQRRSARIRQGR